MLFFLFFLLSGKLELFVLDKQRLCVWITETFMLKNAGTEK